MTFFEVFCANTLSVGMTTIFYVAAAIQLFGEIPYKNRKHCRDIFNSLLLYLFACAFFGTIFYKTGLFAWPHNGGEIIYARNTLIRAMAFLRGSAPQPP